MFKFIFIFLILILSFKLYKDKIHIKIKTFFEKGYKKKDNKFGVYCYVGKQGKGKTQGAYQFLLENKDKRIYANMKSIKGIHYKYFNGLDELLKLRDESNCIIFYDEIFKILTKGSKFNSDIMDFLSQMRKREMIFITTAQEWLEIPLTLRRYCRYMIDCNIYTFLDYPIIVKKFGDSENMVYNPDIFEYSCPIIETVIEHGRYKIVNGYDTFEQIPSISVSPIDIYNPFNNSPCLEDSDSFSGSTTPENEDELGEDTGITITTTNSNSCVIVSVDENCTLNSENNDTLQNTDLSNIDNEFWDSLTYDDFTNNS